MERSNELIDIIREVLNIEYVEPSYELAQILISLYNITEDDLFKEEYELMNCEIEPYEQDRFSQYLLELLESYYNAFSLDIDELQLLLEILNELAEITEYINFIGLHDKICNDRNLCKKCHSRLIEKEVVEDIPFDYYERGCTIKYFECRNCDYEF